MTPEITGLLDKAKQSAEAAQSLLADNYVDFAASRAYYAMFYALEALLLTKSLSFSRHSAVISAFGKEYIKSGILDPCFHRAVIDAFDLRNAGDYGTMHAVSEELASQTIQNARELIQAVSSHIEDIQRPKGFTLVEMAIVLVVIGLLVGMGAGMIGPLTTMSKVRESREVVEADIASVVSWAASNNRLPQWGDGAVDTTIDEFVEVAKKTTDAWGRPLIYLYDNNLFNALPTKDTICGRKTTVITITDNTVTPAATISNVAFAIISQGDDATTQTTLNGTLNGAALNGVITGSGRATGTITLDLTVSDIVRWVTLDELRTKIGCQGAQLKILNNELPYLVSGTDTAAAYNAIVTADGGVLSSGYRWCVQGTAITGLTFTPNIFSADCTALRQMNEANWLSGSSLTITRTPATPPYQTITPNSYSFTVYVSDNSDTSTNDNITSKSFVLTVNP